MRAGALQAGARLKLTDEYGYPTGYCYTSVSLAGQRKVSRVVRVVFSYVGTAPVRHDFGRPPPARMDGHRVVSRCLHVGGVPCECVVGQGASWSFVRAGPPRLLRPPVRPKTGGAP